MPTGTPENPYAPPPDQLTYFACHDPLFVHCWTCGAQPGVYCTGRGGTRIVYDYHSRRHGTRLFRSHPARRDIVGLGYCGYCRVAPGRYCVTAAGRPTAPHHVRSRWQAEIVGTPRVYAPYWPGLRSLSGAGPQPTCHVGGWTPRLRGWLTAGRRFARRLAAFGARAR